MTTAEWVLCAVLSVLAGVLVWVAMWSAGQPPEDRESVQRAIRMQLFNLYKDSGQQDKALDQLKQLIVAP